MRPYEAKKMTNDERLYYLAFSAFPGIGPYRFQLLLNYFGSARKIWQSSERELLAAGLGINLLRKFLAFKKEYSADKYIKKLAELQINFVTLQDKLYPTLLREISDPPLVLYIRGNIKKLKKITNPLAVVGTRKMTDYGREITRKIISDLAEKSVTVISGMALGIDTIAHRSAIEYKMPTIAVLGCGVDVVYPAANYSLYWQIINKGGLVFSEYPPGTKAAKGTFPPRNRIISGLARGVLVIEGDKHSGSMITAKDAAIQGREVFAVPGNVNQSTSQGPAMLLKQGAVLTETGQDIIDTFNL